MSSGRQTLFIVRKNLLSAHSELLVTPPRHTNPRMRKFSTLFNQENSFDFPQWKVARDPNEFTLNSQLRTLTVNSRYRVRVCGLAPPTGSCDGTESTSGDLERIPVVASDELLDDFRRYADRLLQPIFHLKSWNYSTIYDLANASLFDAYVCVNRLFADAILKEVKDGDIIIILNSYDLMLLPKMLSDANSSIVVCYSVDAPFPTSEMFRCLPQRSLLLEGMAAAQLVNFMNPSYMRHFTSACTRILGADSAADVMEYGGNRCKLMYMEHTLDFSHFYAACKSPEVQKKILQIQTIFQNKILLLSINAARQVKSVYHKLCSLSLFLETNPEYRSRLVMVQISYGEGSADDKFESKVTDLISRINSTHGSLESVVVHYFYQNVDYDEYLALLNVADCFINCSEYEGFNSCFVEYLACQHSRKRPMIISEFSSLSTNLVGALVVNPWDHEQVAGQLKRALESAEYERNEWFSLNASFLEYACKTNFIEKLLETAVQVKVEFVDERRFLRLTTRAVSAAYRSSKTRLIVLDYDGTLVGIQKTPGAAQPTANTFETLSKLLLDERNVVFIVSGRDRETLESWFCNFPDLGLSAEHGAYVRFPRSGDWSENASSFDVAEWKESVAVIFEYFTERTPGSMLEHKQRSLVWHYRLADPDFGAWQAKECQTNLETSLLTKYPVEILAGKKNLEVRSVRCNKGSCLKDILQNYPKVDFILCAGDDKTDEDMFRLLSTQYSERDDVSLFTCVVGFPERSAAKFCCANPNALLSTLWQLSSSPV